MYQFVYDNVTKLVRTLCSLSSALGDVTYRSTGNTVGFLCHSRMVLKRLYPLLQSKLNNSQHGFLSGKSTCTQLLKFELCKALDNRMQTDVIYLDFKRAFDSVPHSLLIKKLCNIGISGNLLN